MPGEQLVCVWQAAYALNQGSKSLLRENLKKITAEFAILESTHYSEHKFDETFQGDSISFDTYKTFVCKSLLNEGVPIGVLFNDIERACWQLSKKAYKSKLEESDLFCLWQIVNRLSDQGSYPPVVCQDESQWLCEKVASELNKNWKTIQCDFKTTGSTFQEVVDTLERVFFHVAPLASVHMCIKHIHEWLVEEVMKSGWINKRSKNCSGIGNWTNWSKIWLILKPDRLEFYEKPPVEKGRSFKKGQILIDKNLMMETVPDYRSFFKKLSGCFMITDDSAIYEFGETDGEGPDWFHCLEEVMDSYKINITPVQKMLKERQRRREVAKNTSPVSASDIDIDIRADVLEATTKDMVNGQVNPTVKDQPLSRRTGWQFAKKNYEVPEHVLKKGEDKLKAVFMKVDTNGNGWIDPTEFSTFLKGLGLTLTEKEINLVYNTIDKDRNGRISFQEFEEYFMRNVLDEQETGERTAALRAAFMEADRDGSGTLDFKEFTEYYWEKKRNARLDKLMAGFSKLNKKDGDTITFADFENLFAQSGVNMEPPASSGTQSPKVDVIDLLDKELKEEYDEAAAGELEEYIRDRWEKFASFRRLGASGEAVMTGKDNMVADIVPGEYSLKDIALFSDLPPIVPKYTAVKGVRWVSSGVPGKSGELLFPDDFNYVIAVDLATNERLRYYGCSFADAQQVKVSLLYRHGIQDFTYENQYLEDYVEDRGPGIEVHQFSHLDCPLHEDAGVFVIGKFAGEDEIHLTAFEVPVRHTVYAPAGTIHSNDYLKGTWRTMLSDEAEIDHVYLMKKKENGEMENFKFRFE